MTLAPGARFGPYEVLSAIGAGGMGEVYRARDSRLARDVAIKILPELFALDPDRLLRFKREAQILASLNHPNIAAIYGFEEQPGVSDSIGRLGDALILELVEGSTLAERIAQGPIPVDEAIGIAKQIAAALEAAHEHGIIHRDLKPANIKVRPDGTVKVLDFGLAKALEGDFAAAGISQSPTISVAATYAGVILGTAAYMSPEQAKGKPVDKRADIWALGCVLFEMLTGKPCFAGESVSETLAEVIKSEPQWQLLGPAVPQNVASTIRQCLVKDPMRRIRDAGDVRLALDRDADPLSTLVAPQPKRPTTWRRALTHASALVAGGALAGVALLTTARPVPPTVARFRIPLGDDAVFTAIGRQLVALSPDGRTIAYMANNQLYTRPLDQLEAAPLRETTGARNLLFSPDGRSIVYFARESLMRIDIGGGAPVVIAKADNPFGMSWTADGELIYGQGREGLFIVPGRGGEPRNVVKVSEGEQAHGPQVLPGGDWVLFTLLSNKAANWDDASIVVQSLTSGDRKTVIARGRDARYLPTGHLVYGFNGGLVAAPFDLDTLVAGGPVSLLEGVNDAANNTGTVHFTVAPNGSLLYVPDVAAGRRSVLALVDRSGREEVLAAEPRMYTAVRLSPDGTQAVTYDQGGSNTDIWVWHFERQTLTRLTFDPAPDRHPLWSADSMNIVYQSDRDGGGLFTQPADGTGSAVPLLHTPGVPAPFGWAPDGSLIFDELAPQARDIRLLKRDGNPRAETLLASPFSERRPTLSPDGRWLAYESNESGQYEVYVRPFPDVDAGRWQVSRGGGSQPGWSPRGDELYYLSADSMIAVPLQAGRTFAFGSPAPLFPRGDYQFPENARDYAIANDGRFLLLKPAPSGSANPIGSRLNLVLVQNWFEELRQRVPTGN